MIKNVSRGLLKSSLVFKIVEFLPSSVRHSAYYLHEAVAEIQLGLMF